MNATLMLDSDGRLIRPGRKLNPGVFDRLREGDVPEPIRDAATKLEAVYGEYMALTKEHTAETRAALREANGRAEAEADAIVNGTKVPASKEAEHRARAAEIEARAEPLGIAYRKLYRRLSVALAEHGPAWLDDRNAALEASHAARLAEAAAAVYDVAAAKRDTVRLEKFIRAVTPEREHRHQPVKRKTASGAEAPIRAAAVAEKIPSSIPGAPAVVQVAGGHTLEVDELCDAIEHLAAYGSSTEAMNWEPEPEAAYVELTESMKASIAAILEPLPEAV